MRITLRKQLIYLLITVMVIPAWLMTATQKAEASVTNTSTAPANPSSVESVNSTGNAAWSNPGNARISNDLWSTSVINNSSDHTNNLRASGFGFSIPINAVVNGITASVEKHQTCTTTCSGSQVTDYRVYLVKTNSAVGSNLADFVTAWPLVDTIATYGGSSNLWGTTWNPSQINNSDFGLLLSATRDSGGDRTVYVDSISLTVSYTLPDTTTPTIPVLNSPANDVYINNSPLNLAWGASSDIDDANPSYNVQIDSDAPVSVGTTTSYSANITALSQGSHTWRVNATDGVNTSEWSTQRTFIKDTVVPVIDSIMGFTGTTGESTTVTVNAHDTILLNSVEISVNGGVYQPMVGTGTFTFDIAVPSNSAATIDYVIKATDEADNSVESTTQHLVVADNDFPVINSKDATPNTTGEVMIFTINATDNIGIVSASVSINNAPFVPLGGSEPNYTYGYTLPNHTLEHLDYQLKFIDAAGNTTTSETVTIIPVDNDNPNITSVDGTTGTTGDNTPVTVTATDNIAPVRAKISIDGGLWVDMTGSASPFTYLVPVPANSLNDITYQVRVYDAADNFENSDNLTITVTDNDAPNKPVATPATGEYDTTQVVDLASSDNIAACIKIYYTLDGTDPNSSTSELFVNPINISKDLTLKAIAYDEAGNPSEVMTEKYEIAPQISGQYTSSVTDKSVTINWITDFASTSRVIYDTVSHPGTVNPATAPNYGYAYSTVEVATKVTSHSVTITGLDASKAYYYRVISHGSPVTVSSEQNFTTSNAPTVVLATAPVKTTVKAVSSSNSGSTGTGSVAPQTTTPTPTNPDNNGQIKGEETSANDESDDFNWTPWIILIIIILLAGAATGGYFYWTREEDNKEEQAQVKVTKKAPIKETIDVKKKSASKKSNRW